jgi:hypothetical protein
MSTEPCAAAAALLSLSHSSTARDEPPHAKKKQRVEPVATQPLCATGERWCLVNDGARISSFGRYQAPGRAPRTVRNEGRRAYVNLKGTNTKIDTLVASAFLPPPGRGVHELVHLDGDCHNDRADNLRWVPCEGAKGRRAHALASVRRQCPHPATAECLLAQLLQERQGRPMRHTQSEEWVQLDTHRNSKGLCPSVSSWGRYLPAGKENAHEWGETNVRAVCINGRKLMLDRLVADTFVPKVCALADQLVHLDGDPQNCRADNLAWHLHPSRDPGVATSEMYSTVAPAVAERAAAYYRRKTGAASPEAQGEAMMQWQQRQMRWAAAGALEIKASAVAKPERRGRPEGRGKLMEWAAARSLEIMSSSSKA